MRFCLLGFSGFNAISALLGCGWNLFHFGCSGHTGFKLLKHGLKVLGLIVFRNWCGRGRGQPTGRGNACFLWNLFHFGWRRIGRRQQFLDLFFQGWHDFGLVGPALVHGDEEALLSGQVLGRLFSWRFAVNHQAANAAWASTTQEAKHGVGRRVFANLFVLDDRPDTNVRAEAFTDLLHAFLKPGNRASANSTASPCVASSLLDDVVKRASDQLAGYGSTNCGHHALQRGTALGSLLDGQLSSLFG